MVYDRLPIPTIVSRFAEAFQFDPLRMISSGTLAVTLPADRVDDVSAHLAALGVPSALVGQVVVGEGVRVLRGGECVAYADIRCEEDELARMWARYPRD